MSDETAVLHRPRTRSTGLTVLLVLALLVADGLGGVALYTERRTSADTRALIDQLNRTQAATEQAAAADRSVLHALRAQVSGLAGQLASTQNQLKADEKQLKIAQQQLPPDLIKLAGQVLPSVVLIGCGNGGGSGFALDIPAAAGYDSAVVTAAHVVAACAPDLPGTPAKVTITYQGRTLPVQVRATDAVSDVAILDVAGALPALKPGLAPVVGETVVAVGNPLGMTNNVTNGIVSQVGATSFLNTAAISNGNSGGPLVDRSGLAIGIADAAGVPTPQNPVVQNLNVALRLSILCARLLSGPSCQRLN